MSTATKLTATEIFNQTNTIVLSYIIKKVGNVETAKDISGDVFEKVTKFAASFDENKSKLVTWVLTIANHAIIDYYRSRVNNDNMKTNNIEAYTNDQGEACFNLPSTKFADSDLNNSELKQSILNAFDSLNDNTKDFARFFFLYEYSHEEISTMLNVPIGTVKAMIHRARKVLQANLNPVSARNKEMA